MRIHRLEMAAFGPFAHVQEIDFDALSSQGLFLLNGATGAGKTSVLDAICFALYGSVPGARQDGKRLRSDHAAPDAEPRVVCEFSARGRHFEVTRVPAWDRPSTRGKSGFTQQKARTLLREKIAGSWVEKSYRNDEAGAEIAGVLGMDRDQFTRVVMLPQGDFAAFLRSKATDRMDLLQKLFGTQRFEAIERELAREAADARAAVTDNEHGLRLLLERAEAEVLQLRQTDGGEAGSATPESLGPEDRLLQLEALARSEEARRLCRASEARDESSALETRLRGEQERAERHMRLRAAVKRQAELEERRDDVETLRLRLAAHRRAAVLGGQLDSVHSAAKTVAAARVEVDRCADKLAAAGLDAVDLGSAVLGGAELAEGALDPDSLVAETVDRALRRVQETAAVLEARLGDEKQLADVTRRIAELETTSGEREKALKYLESTIAALESEVVELRAATEPLEVQCSRLAELEAAAVAARAAHALTDLYAVAHRELVLAREREREAVAGSLAMKKAWLDIREARLANAAGELAAKLEDGSPCPVCGSCQHPSPAAAGPAILTLADDEESARVRFEDSDRAAASAGRELAAAEQRLAVLAAQGGDMDPEEAARTALSATAALTSAKEAQRSLAQIREELALLVKRMSGLEREKAAEESAMGQDRAAAAMLREQQRLLEHTLGGLRAGHTTLSGRLDALNADRRLLQEAAEASERLDRALEQAMAAEEALAKALPSAGFASAAQARQELLDAAEADRAEVQVRQFDAEAARLQELFSSGDLVLAAEETRRGDPALPVEELARLEAEAAEAADSARRLELAAGLASKAVGSLQGIRAEYAKMAEAGRGPREHAALLAQLSDTVRGTGDNSYRMSLNSYVLAARLEQVASAASERLVAMSDGRYTLRHSDAKAARGAKSGLGLEVVDEWTGQNRDTSTLSGGESFMASLSLALGLADVVQQEAGGVDIETLFVDEGFGSLDEQALEQVMNALEGLREGGRVVGLVSHVAEMKQRIGTQLQVIKGRNGSNVKIMNTAA